MNRKAVYIFFLILYLFAGIGSLVYAYLQGDISYASILEMLNTLYSMF